jgi:iron(III) transport system substrate-binding protein
MAVLLVAGLSACGGGGSTNGLTLYSGQHPQTTAALMAAFTKQTGIHVNIRSGDENALASQIRQEGSSSPADVFFAENSPAITAVEEKGLLAPADPGALAAVPAQYSPSDHDWVGVSARVSALVSHNGTADLPTSILDLADPRFKGKIGITPTETDFQPLVASVAKARGTDAALAWLRALKSNAGSHSYPDSETLVKNVDNGTVAMGVINTYYWYRAAQETGNMSSTLTYFASQDPGYVLDTSGAGVLRSSKHQADAQKLLAFLVSAQGEGILAHSFSFEYPLGSNVAADPRLKPFASLQPAALTLADIGDGTATASLLQRAQLA